MTEYTELEKVAGPAVTLRLSVYDGGPDLTVEWADAPDPAHLTATAVTLLAEYRAASRTEPTREDPPRVRCGMCDGRCRWNGRRVACWIDCRRCSWSSHDPRRSGWWWRLRVWIGR